MHKAPGVMTNPTPRTVDVCAVVVTYNPNEAVVGNVEKLRAQAARVFVVDNGSGSDSAGALQALERLPTCRVIRNEQNLGIAAALNRGIRIASDEGFTWVATFDQDSTIDANFFVGLLATYNACPFRERVALVSPRHVYPEAATNDRVGNDTEFSVVRTAMTSGSLIKTRVLAAVGLYDEALFIDYVDYDHCLRLQRAGFRLIRANRVRLLHRLGTAEEHRLFGRAVSIKSHSAWRRYYITRNRVLLYRRYGFSFPGWCLHDAAWFFVELGKIVMFEQAKAAKMRMVAKGLWHGLTGKTGPLVQAPG